MLRIWLLATLQWNAARGLRYAAKWGRVPRACGGRYAGQYSWADANILPIGLSWSSAIPLSLFRLLPAQTPIESELSYGSTKRYLGWVRAHAALGIALKSRARAGKPAAAGGPPVAPGGEICRNLIHWPNGKPPE